MSSSNGVIRIGRKGLKEFAFGEDGPVFKIDVVTTFHEWLILDENFRPEDADEEGNRGIPRAEMPAFVAAAQAFVKGLQGEGAVDVTAAEAMDFLARLREQFNELASFFLPKSPVKQESPDSSEEQSAVRFSVEGETPK